MLQKSNCLILTISLLMMYGVQKEFLVMIFVVGILKSLMCVIDSN